MRLGWFLLFALAACGDDGSNNPAVDAAGSGDGGPPADADTRDIAERLSSLPGVTSNEYVCNYSAGARCFELYFQQPVDHDAPGAMFLQNVTLVHRDALLPMVAVTTGYWNFYQDYPYELAQLLGANQIVIEHRFFQSSRPNPADWSKLTIQQSAADQHHIIELLRTIYGKPWLTTGASKGGMTASYHRRFHPDDVEGTVPYVAPLSFAAGDMRYAQNIDAIGPAPCRQALRDVAVELLKDTRFEAMVSRAQMQSIANGTTFNRIALRPSVESSIVGIEWSFWQYTGVAGCNQVPATTASDAVMWAFLDRVSGVTSDADLDLFDAYYYQAEYELGYPDDGTADYVTGKTRYTAADYAGGSPPGAPIPTFRPEAMADIDQWVRSSGSRFLFIYGEWDPWSGGKYALGNALDSQESIAPQLHHGAGLVDLTPTDKAAAYARLEAWTGVAPDEGRLMQKRLPPRALPHVPPPILRALRLRR